MRKLWRFTGGIKLKGFNKPSNTSSIHQIPIPEKLILPLRQHIGEATEPLISIGQRVFKGELLASSTSFISAPVHASSSGTIVDIGKYSIPHQSGISETCIVIETDGLDEWDSNITANIHPEKLSRENLHTIVKSAGIVGLGGAAFPSAAKLKPTRKINSLIINGVECEPYISCDDALMQSRPDEIIRGVILLQRMLEPNECIIAIEDNKPKAIDSLRTALEKLANAGVLDTTNISVIPIPTIFPAGSEKQLVKVLTGKEIPQHGLPYEVGVVCLNVGTTSAIYDAVYHGQPLISRVVTVTGSEVNQPDNYNVLLGTPVVNLLNAAGSIGFSKYKLIMGGPMMGMNLPNSDVPVVKATNCILVEKAEQEKGTKVMPCIRCGTCTTVCPMKLLPQQLYWHAKSKNLEKLDHFNLSDCIECGCCAVVCPSKIPLVHYFRYAKSEKKEHEIKLKIADQSRIRSLVRESRLEKSKREQEERKAKRKAERKKKKASIPKKDKAIEGQSTSVPEKIEDKGVKTKKVAKIAKG